jgi:hypothetical protein
LSGASEAAIDFRQREIVVREDAVGADDLYQPGATTDIEHLLLQAAEDNTG